ncbi:MAG: tyrosinase family protein [Chloroflexota bacterium]|nr:tyrosinase family protein [Chloroflexota bacterium]
MRTELAINGRTDATGRYVTWSPSASQVRLSDSAGATGPVAVRLRNRNPLSGGQVVFLADLSQTPRTELQLILPVNGSAVQFFIAGQFGKPSRDDGDATVEVVTATTNEVLGSTPLMVRIRKNANMLSPGERNRFRSALATLNNRGMGRFSDFRKVHGPEGYYEEHERAGFLPWHRAFILDLERELQAIDPSVTLPYWKFDEPAPNLFDPEFMGAADPNDISGTVRFSAANPLQFFTTDGTPGVIRSARFNTRTQAANVRGDNATLLLGGQAQLFASFRRMEINPHGSAHTSFGGFIRDPTTAAKDPLFFLLHTNVDRLWARWQWLHGRFDVASTSSYQFLGRAGSVGATRVGHNLLDTMWPWNGATGGERPPIAPGGPFPATAAAAAPGPAPDVRAMIDFQGLKTAASRLGFDYDDVPYQPG